MSADADADRVVEITGMTTFTDYGVYSGMLDIADTTKSLHYVFVESQNDPATDPLLLWFNGGPGCSSMLAWMQEHGPWVMDDGDTTFHENPYSWNKNANVLYIDQPAGIGYSWCNETENPDDCASGDFASSLDNLDVLKTWFGRFPDYKANDFYLSGESYAGIYVPYLLKTIDTYNNDPETAAAEKINLKGMMVGNGVTNWAYDTMPATIDMGYWRSILGQDLHDSINQLACNYSLIDFGINPSDECMDLLNQVENDIEFINIYNIYGICYGGKTDEEKFSNDLETYRHGETSRRGLRETPQKKGFTARDYTPWLFRSNKDKGLVRSSKDEASYGELPPCTFGIPLMDFMNDATVREQLHIPTYVQSWTMCKDDFNYTMFENATQSIWDTKELYDNYRMMKYSGDKDGCVPTIGTLGWINALGRTITADWRTWYLEDNQTLAGYVQEFEGLTFISVHGAGHMVPQDQREAGLTMINYFMSGKELPKKADPPSDL